MQHNVLEEKKEAVSPLEQKNKGRTKKTFKHVCDHAKQPNLANIYKYEHLCEI